MTKKVVRKKVTGKDHEEVDKTVIVEKSMGGGDKETLKEVERKAERHSPDVVFREGMAKVGLSKGMTINLGNYQSARIDCSIVRICEDGDRAIMDELANISTMLDEQLEFEVEELQEKEEEKPSSRKRK